MASRRMSEVLQRLGDMVQPPAEAERTDGQLLGAYVTGRDGVALAALVRRHSAMVWGVCRRLLRHEPDAEDAFQATFLVLVRKAASVVPREMVANWLYGVARQTALKARATAAKRVSRERQTTDMPEPPVAQPDPQSDLEALLDEELGRLPDKYRTALVLCELEGKTRKEAAAQLDVPEGTVASRLAAARAMLARRLTQRGVAASAAALTAALGQHAAASVPPALMSAALKAAAGVITGNAAVLAEGVLKNMLLNKLKIVTAGSLVLITLGLAGVLMVAAQADKPTTRAEEALAKELKSLQGTWKVVGMESDGKKAPADYLKEARWTFKGQQLEITHPKEKAGAKSEVKLDPRKSPGHFDMVALDGPRKGDKILGIYKWEKGRLIICLLGGEETGTRRPKEFGGDEDNKDQVMFTLEPLTAKPVPETKPEVKPKKAEAVVPPAKPPRYRLEVGQELVYSGEERSAGPRSRTRGGCRVWVVRANKDGGWRLVLRSSREDVIRKEVVSFAWCDLSPDGRIAENDSFGPAQMDPRNLLPSLPADRDEAVKGWQTTGKNTGNTHRYRLVPPKAGRLAFEVECESPLLAAVGAAMKAVFTWDAERGLPDTIQAEVTYADKRVDRSSVKLDEVKTHDPAWCREFAEDAERYFTAEASYRRVLARWDGTAAEVKARLEKAAADLKTSRASLKRDEFHRQVDALLAGHEQQAAGVLELAKRRGAIVGKPAADWATTDLDGKPHGLKGYRGKVVILDFWCRECFWCVKAMPQVKGIAARFADQPVVVLGMNTDAKEEDARLVVKKMGLTYATLKAAKIAEEYKVQSFPTLLVIDQEGVVRDVHFGYSATLEQEVAKSVEALLKAGRVK